MFVTVSFQVKISIIPNFCGTVTKNFQSSLFYYNVRTLHSVQFSPCVISSSYYGSG